MVVVADGMSMFCWYSLPECRFRCIRQPYYHKQSLLATSGDQRKKPSSLSHGVTFIPFMLVSSWLWDCRVVPNPQGKGQRGKSLPGAPKPLCGLGVHPIGTPGTCSASPQSVQPTAVAPSSSAPYSLFTIKVPSRLLTAQALSF